MKETSDEKFNLHPRNIHRQPYDFKQLIAATPELEPFVVSQNNQLTIDFSNSDAVLLLNKSLLAAYYGVSEWNLPQGYLTPGIPGRADYIHHIADLLAETTGEIPVGTHVIGLDIGTGANMVYPLIGNSVYKWSFVATDIDKAAIENCVSIIRHNPELTDAITLQQQLNPRHIFTGIITPEDRFAFTICNPPFHASAAEAEKGALRKIGNLTGTKPSSSTLNFGGRQNELWREGGELKFIGDMIFESKRFHGNCMWFTSLVSKASNLPALERTLSKVGVASFKTINMSQGQKTSRILAWTFLTENQLKAFKF